MIFHPFILSLLLGSILIALMMLYSTFFGIQILRRWDLKSGSEAQLILERKTYLVSTFLSFTFGFELLSLFLYIYTADCLHALFVGAMCAAGSLYVNSFGYPTLIIKIVNFLMAGLWLIVNVADNRGYDYPLIKIKYSFLLFLMPVILVEIIFQALYFLQLKPDIITSCCGTLFSSGAGGRTAEIGFLSVFSMKIIFYGQMIMTILSGFYYYLKGRGGYLFSLLCFLCLVISTVSILSFISLYFYELPTHHCPFCLLQREYGYIGYPLYFSLFGGTLCGLGVGILMPFKTKESLSDVLPALQKRLALAATIFFLFFMALVSGGIFSSSLRL